MRSRAVVQVSRRPGGGRARESVGARACRERAERRMSAKRGASVLASVVRARARVPKLEWPLIANRQV